MTFLLTRLLWHVCSIGGLGIICIFLTKGLDLTKPVTGIRRTLFKYIMYAIFKIMLIVAFFTDTRREEISMDDPRADYS
jgi:hypothetical protein